MFSSILDTINQRPKYIVKSYGCGFKVSNFCETDLHVSLFKKQLRSLVRNAVNYGHAIISHLPQTFYHIVFRGFFVSHEVVHSNPRTSSRIRPVCHLSLEDDVRISCIFPSTVPTFAWSVQFHPGSRSIVSLHLNNLYFRPKST